SGSLSGCSTNGGASMARVFGLDGISFPDATDKSSEFQRYRQAYDKYATADGEHEAQLRHFADAYLRIRSEYVRTLTEKELVDSAIEGITKLEGKPGTQSSVKVTEAALNNMLASLDPHSSYLDPQAFREIKFATRGEFGGLGIEINKNEAGNLEIISPIEDTPAYRAGLKSGDQITHVESDPIKDMTLLQAVRRLRGKPQTDVNLTVQRPVVGSFKVTITRAVIRVRPVRFSVENDIGVIRIRQFNQRAQPGLEDAMRKLKRQVGDRLKGIVIDLRNNPGGLLDQSVSITDSFLRSGSIVSVRDRQGEVRSFNADSGDISQGLPLVVLINSGSASASEIVAGALQDHNRAVVMGGQSFGKGSVQTITPLNWAGALRLTTQLYYLPSGRSIQGDGVVPDIVITPADQPVRRRESDNPKSIQQDHLPLPGSHPKARTSVKMSEQSCPVAGDKKDDRLLGCALTFITAGSQAKFMAVIEGRKTL
ncbi:MAG: S41 family peptidase, partial [Proteobacteria bacterium]|nr:S41 family peptidase [Pseudomonadota bacterium]